VLVANGIGASAALRYAVAHPKRVLGLALLAPVGFPGDTRSGRMLTRLLGSRAALRRFEGLVNALALGPTTEAVRAVAERHRAFRASADHASAVTALAALWRDAIRTTDLPELAKRVSAPAQVYRGALDPLVTAAEARLAAEDLGERGALEVTLPEAGHLPFLQQPERFFQALSGLVNTAELAAAQLS
jgi:pimeloyl-ACP methyl ester carboxylesterase